jgi:hypothetical protein
MGTVYTNGQIPVCIKEIGSKIKFQVTENTLGMMAEHIMDTGLIIICMDKVYIRGLMVGNMKENI